MIPKHDITAVILAGGRGRRMDDADKGWVMLDGEPLISHVIRILLPQVSTMIISANRNLARYRELGFPVISDKQSGFAGPLAGIASALDHVKTSWALVVACDMPRLSPDLVARLVAAVDQHQADIAVAHDGQSIQPVVMLLRGGVAASMETALEQGQASVKTWLGGQNCVAADFSDVATSLTNVNTPEQLASLEQEAS